MLNAAFSARITVYF